MSSSHKGVYREPDWEKLIRNVHGILLATACLLTGCGGGGVSSNAPNPPPIVWDDPPSVAEDLDYLGQFYGSDADGWWVFGAGENVALVDSCADDAKDRWPSAACIEGVSRDGIPADLSDLKPGQIVEIHGTIKSLGYSSLDRLPGVAIDIRRTIVGPIDEIDADRPMLRVLGQQVYYVDQYGDPATLSLALGDVVTVYGHFTADGQVLATLIEPYTGEPSYLVRGVLQELAPNRFAVGALEVDLANATREDFPGGAPIAGDAVIVFGDRPPEQGVLTASTVRCVGACQPARWENGHARGFLTAWRSATDFDVDGVAIRPSWCECAYGASPALGTYVDVAIYGANAELLLAPSTSHSFGLTGLVTATDQVTRELIVLGYRVQVSPATQVTATPQEYPNVDALIFDELNVGDMVQVSGEARGGVVVAGSIVRQGDTAQVRAYSFTLNDPMIEVAGHNILTNSATLVNRCDEAKSPVSLDEFFATDWADQYTVLSIAVDPDSAPLVAQQVEACTLADL